MEKGASAPLVSDHPISKKLWKTGLDRKDAHHLMLVIVSACDVFLTCDHGILNRASEIEAEFTIRVMKPSEFVHNDRCACGNFSKQ